MSRSDITKQALARALTDELETKRLDRVTVTDVTTRCGISRQAFYYHFDDIYDLATWTWEREAKAALDEAGGYDYANWRQGLLAILHLLARRRNIVMRAIHVIDPTYVNRFLRRHVTDLMLRVVREASDGVPASDEDRELVAHFYAAGFINVVYLWFSDGMVERPEDLVDRLALLVQGDIPAALERLSGRRG